MVWIARLVGLDVAQQVMIALAVVIGHNWSVFLRFNAGRGVATTLGVDIILMPWLAIIIGAVIVIILAVGSSPIPVLVGMAALAVFSWLFHGPLSVTVGLIALFVIMVVRRLTAPRMERSARVKTSDLLLNRFLFDRDMRDGKEWVKFKQSSKPEK
jgi:glycerol-3-phosphate acyltransferase PlsY